MPPIPVQRLGRSASAAYLSHLLALDLEDRRLRFGVPHSSAAIAAYVERIDFDSDSLFGVHCDALVLQGVAHLALGGGMAELGISVLPEARRSGIGRALMQRAAVYARNRSVTQLHVYCLADNVAMMRLARHAGMDVVVPSGDAEAHIALPAPTPSSVGSEYIAEHIALLDHAVRTSVDAWGRVGFALAQSSSP